MMSNISSDMNKPCWKLAKACPQSQILFCSSENNLPTSSPCFEQQMTVKTIDKNSIPKSQENINDYTINHTKEVVIGSEQGTTFPTKVCSTLCNALFDMGAIRSCMSEAYYQKLHLYKIWLLSNICVRSATGSNLSP